MVESPGSPRRWSRTRSNRSTRSNQSNQSRSGLSHSRSGINPSRSGLNRHGLEEEEDYSPERSIDNSNNAILDENASSGNIPVDSVLSPASSSALGGDDSYFVTSPPKRSGLTGSISTLFRRVASRDRPRVEQSASEYEADIVLPDDDDADPGDICDVLSDDIDCPAEEGRVSEQAASTDFLSSSAPSATSQEEEDLSVVKGNQFTRGKTRTRSNTKRIYSSYTDDDSDDSFESRHPSTSEAISPVTTRDSEYLDSESLDENDPRRRLKRYRGFSTSIASLFLDESLVCSSIGCFGLILSNRTEYLLQVRDHIRGVKQSKKNQTAEKRSPSKVFSYLLLLTIVLIFMTFVIWGFGNGNALAEDLYNGDSQTDDYVQDDQTDDEGNERQQQDDYYADQDDVDQNNEDDAVQNDDNVNNADDQNNDDQANDDGYNYNNGANDDGANNDDNNNNDDAQQNDDNNANNDDGAGNDDGANDDGNGGDDYYAADNDDDNGRKLEGVSKSKDLYPRGANDNHHRVTGVFKLRDCQEHIWNPVIDFATEQYNREARAGRLLADSFDDDFTSSDYSAPARDLATDIRTALFLTFLLFLGVLGRRRRMRTRFQLVRARSQDDRLHHITHSRRSRHVSMKDELEDKAYEVACSHTILGCYPVDPPSEDCDEDEEELEVNDQEHVVSKKKAKKHEDFVSRGFSCLMAACCGYLCKCWFQCLSVCALAQEAREMRLLLPPRYQRIDYITHQPFSEYQKDVNELRRGWMGKKRKKSGFAPHFSALSRLSRYILFTAATTLFVILATLIFNPRASFSWPDAVLLLATFVQSFLVLYIVHWIFHKSDLSLDAVIKFFAAGFVIAVPSAVFFEGILVNIILVSAWTVYEIAHSLIGETFAEWMASNYRVIWVLGELFNAYIVAAVTEELCKYYTFRCVEHPDLIFLTGLDRKSHDEHAAEGGLVSYPFGSHRVSDLNNPTKSFDTQKSDEDKLKKMLPSAHTMEEFYEDENDVRTYRQKAAAVTTGMISVAVGLACAENMMYVFLLGGARGSSTSEHRGDVYEEWIVLLFRSVFPIHALAAALQSVNMVRKFVEGSNHNSHRIGVGRIILPAVILHGTFDAILMGINVYVESAWDAYLEENEGRIGEGEPYNPTTVNFAAWCSICMVTLIGFSWYIREHRNQQSRLVLLEEAEKEEQSYISPAGIPPQSTKRAKV